MPTTNVSGIMSVWKPRGMTSFDVVRRLRRAGNVKRVGHAGTLDPAAEGILPILFGHATRLSSRIEEFAKTYDAVVLLGTTTDTLDMDGRVLDRRPTDGVTEEAVRAVLPEFSGALLQVPPMFSALKHEGVRLYEIARRGDEVERKPRKVIVHSIEVTDMSLPHLAIRVTCGRGTYIRSIAADIGEKLGCGAVLESLRRVRVGPFREAESVPMDVAETSFEQDTVPGALLPAVSLYAGWPALRVGADHVARLRSGSVIGVEAGEWEQISGEPDPVFSPGPAPGAAVALGPDGALLALARETQPGRWHPHTVFPADDPGRGNTSSRGIGSAYA